MPTSRTYRLRFAATLALVAAIAAVLPAAIAAVLPAAVAHRPPGRAAGVRSAALRADPPGRPAHPDGARPGDDRLDPRLRAAVRAVEAAAASAGPSDPAAATAAEALAAIGAEGRGSDARVRVTVLSDGPVDLSHLADAAVSNRGPLGRVVTLARVPVGSLRKVAGLAGVAYVEDTVHPWLEDDRHAAEDMPSGPDPAAVEARMAELAARDLPYRAAPGDRRAPGGPPRDAWYDAAGSHFTALAWRNGWTGSGVRVGVADTGVDFATPELVGTWATVEDPASPYHLWPQALDAAGLLVYLQDRLLGGEASVVGEVGHVRIEQAAEASRTGGGDVGTACFRRIRRPIPGAPPAVDETPTCDYRVPWRSRSGTYRFGAHPDPVLFQRNSERPGVLLVDEAEAGVYDTVYVDLDNDRDFVEEKPARRGDPLVYRDQDGDGWADLSGGLVYWISDGVSPPPGSWLWPDFDVPPAEQGRLVVFLTAFGASATATDHGTLCASNVAGQGVLPVPAGVDLRFGDLPGDGRPPYLLRGAAPGARVVGIHRGGVATTESAYWYAAFGHDKDRPGDEVHVLSNSYPLRVVDNEGWDYASRLVDHLTAVNPNLTFLFSTGNGGPGYGSLRDPHPAGAIKVAASTQSGSTGYDSITATTQIAWGDIVPFSSMGPASDGTHGPHVAADGAYATGAGNVNTVANGARTIETWGGTSRSTPVAAGHVALIYQAFHARHGRWPTAEESRAILMAGATWQGYDPFMAGAGVVHGGRSAFIAAGRDGLYATPSSLVPGDYRGTAHPSFPKLVSPGAATTTTLTLHNPSPRDIEVTLAAVESRRVRTHTFAWTSEPASAESAYFSEVPDYVIPVPVDEIPAGTELMAIRARIPLAESDIGLDYTANLGGAAADNVWFLSAIQHTDVDGDGRLWEDRDGNRTVGKATRAPSRQLDGILDLDWAATELDRWEFARLSQDTRRNNNLVVWVHHPLERWADGLYVGLHHRGRPDAVPRTRIELQLEFYRAADWPWLTFAGNPTVLVPAAGTRDVRVRVDVPPDAAYGYFQGAIVGTYAWRAAFDPSVAGRTAFLPLSLRDAPLGVPVAGPPRTGAPARPHDIPVRAPDTLGQDADAPGQAAHAPGQAADAPDRAVDTPGQAAYTPRQAAPADAGHADTAPPDTVRMLIPVQVNVAATLPERGGVALVGPSGHATDLPYANGIVRGHNFWNYGSESGDWRFFPVDVPAAPEAGTRLVLHSRWDDAKAVDAAGTALPRSDIDTLIFGPTADRWSDPDHPDNSGANLADPARFGPATTEETGASANTNTAGGVWTFDTRTGDYEEWVTAPARRGLNVVMAHHQLLSGARFDVPFWLDLERARLAPDAVDADGPGCRAVAFTPDFDLGPLTATGYGLAPVVVEAGETGQDDPGNALTAAWRRTFTFTHGTRIELTLTGPDGGDGTDLDLFLYRDADGNGEPAATERVAASTSPEASEHIALEDPADGVYIVAVHGWAVPSGTARFDLERVTIQGAGVSVTGVPPGDVAAGETVALEVCYTLPAGAGLGTYRGEAYLGPEGVARLFSLPIAVTVP